MTRLVYLWTFLSSNKVARFLKKKEKGLMLREWRFGTWKRVLLIFKMCSNHILKCQKISNKNLAHASRYCTCSQSRFAKNRQLMCRVWNRQNPVLKNDFQKASFWHFYTSHKKCRFSPKLDLHTYNVEMYVPKFCLNFFHTLKYFFHVQERAAPKSTNGFLLWRSTIILFIVNFP